MSSPAPSDPANTPESIEPSNAAPDESQRRRREEQDEWLAVILSLLAVLGIFWWITGRDRFPVGQWMATFTGDSSVQVDGTDRAQKFDDDDGLTGDLGLGGGDRSGRGDDAAGDRAKSGKFSLAGAMGFGAGSAGSDGNGGDGSRRAQDSGAIAADGTDGNGGAATGDKDADAAAGATGEAGADGKGKDTNGSTAADGNAADGGAPVPPPPAKDASTPSETPLPSPAAAPQAFDDVPNDHWAAPFVNQVTKLGLIEGFPDNTFKPDEPVTRAQIAAVVSQTYKERKGTVESKAFSDVARDFWGTEGIAKTVEIEFMKGYPDGTFKPEKPLPRLEALLTFVAGLKLKPTVDPDTVLGQFPDGDQVPDWARPAIAAAVENKLITNPKGNSLDLKTTATRADIAAIVYQALTSENKVGAVDSPHLLGK